jgi:aminocarboxymuconate-semialdehyde decarboxylase
MKNENTTIDMHTHFIPPSFEMKAPSHSAWGARIEQRNGQKWAVHEQGFAYPFFETFLGGTAKLEDMDARGIDISLLSLSPTLFFYWINGSDARSFVRMANEELGEIARSSGGRLLGLAALPMQDPDAAAEELRFAVEELGLLGAQIGSSIEDRHLDHDSFSPLWEAADSLGVPIMLHPYYVGPRPGLEDYYLTNIFFNPTDTALAASRLIFSGLFERHSNLRIVLVHGGGFLPYQLGRLDHGWKVRSEPKEKIAKPPSAYLEHFYFDTITHNDAALAWLTEFMGDDRVLMGTDLPYDMGDDDPTTRIDRALSSEASKERVAGMNAMKLFGITQPTDGWKTDDS